MADIEEAGDWLRCVDCKKLFSKTLLLRIGACPACGGSRVRGGSPTKWEQFLIQIRRRK